jgi:cytochrome d ubiquinol oxidase subunit II
MEAAWFAIVSAMLAVYTVLDGFDFGVGIVHRLVARTEEERRTVLAAIGPVWDGNEVWLIAAGGVLFMAFPKVYATVFSGFYMALMVVLWLLILRGVAIEFRSHQDHPLWREFWDTVFSLASALLAVVFGTTLGNLVRGVPLGKQGLPGMPLFTNFRPGREPGILDWYTGLAGVFTLTALAGHGALYLAWRTAGAVRERSLAFAPRAWKAVFVLWVAATAATAWVQPEALSNVVSRPWALAFVALSAAGIFGVF